MADVTIIIVTWNSRTDLVRCLPSIPAAASGCSHDLIVVDNASADGTVAYVEAVCPGARVIVNGENLGFAAANNQALRVTKGRYALLLNPDTVLRPNAIDMLVAFMDSTPDAWAAGPAILNSNNTLQRTGVRFPNTWNLISEALALDRLFPLSRVFGRHRELFKDPAEVQQVDYVQGSCLIVNGIVPGKVGILDEEFFMYFEETDWCFRMQQAGGRVYIVPSARVVHLGGEGPGHFDEFRLVAYHRGLLMFYRKHHAVHDRIVVRLVILVRSVIRIAVWTAMLVFSPSMRRSAWSSIKGYFRVLGLLVRQGT